MKTILYNPIFINPQAYYVFPRLTRWLQPDEESVLEPANYIGSIEVKIIAYGDFEIGYTRNFMNTSEIDFSDFRNSYVRISLFTSLGSVVLGEWKIGDLESTIIDPAVLESLKAVVICDGKTNEDSDRTTIRNLVDSDNSFVASNFAWTEESGYNTTTYDGALVFDGVDDRVVSTKTMQEMVGDTQAVTVVSMIHQIELESIGYARNQYFSLGNNFIANNISVAGKTGIYGYKGTPSNTVVINEILGDKADYARVQNNPFNSNSIFSVNGTSVSHYSQIAWYWTIIADKVLTTDEIHQVIAYYNLDKHVKPDIYYDVKKQGLTNENHTQFNDKLIDYSGNGHDMQMYNISWNETSGANADDSLVLDGIDDYGKVTGVPVYKDYTIVGEITAPSGNAGTYVASKAKTSSAGAFIWNPQSTTYSFGTASGSNTGVSADMSFKYQTKYLNSGKAISAGSASDCDIMWLGTVRDNDSRFADIAINSLMTFPYSLDEFLIERQLKRHKLGTLHPDLIEFRPIVKVDGKLDEVNYFLNNYSTKLYPGDYIPKGSTVYINVVSTSAEDEFKHLKINGKKVSIKETITSTNRVYVAANVVYTKAPLKIEVSLDNYIGFENIQQPYPFYLSLVNAETDEEYTWGDKIKYGTKLQVIKKSNLLVGIYKQTIDTMFTWNGNVLSQTELMTKEFTVGKDKLVFGIQGLACEFTNEPNVIAAPQKLRLPNISYKRLGHIPDISGHGNNIKLYNSGYRGMSGANGYGVDFGIAAVSNPNNGKLLTKEEDYLEYEVINISPYFVYFKVKANDAFTLYSDVDFALIYTDGTNIVTTKANVKTKVICPKDGTLQIVGSKNPATGDIITIQQVGLYDGAFCFDGVNDYGIINKSIISKQQFIKLNRLTDKNASIIDNRTADIKNSYIISSQSSKAYVNYPTYIDGTLNENVLTKELNGVTHNAIIQNTNNVAAPVTLMASYDHYNYLKAAMYAYVSFPEISDESEIIRFNEIMGIEGKYVEKPNYYWDVYGKKNTDADKDTIIDQVTKLPANVLSLKNVGYEGMSGYDGYPVIFGSNKTFRYYSSSSPDEFVHTGDDNKIALTQIYAGRGLLYSYLKQSNALTEWNKDYPSFRIRVTGTDTSKFKLVYYYLASANAISIANYPIDSDGVYTLPKSFASDGSLTASDVCVGIVFRPIGSQGIVYDVNITLEILPDYENGLALDGVNDYLENTTLPALTDFTFITKRKHLLSTYENNAVYIYKGLDAKNRKWALLGDYWYNGKCVNYIYNKASNFVTPFDLIGFITPTNYNGTALSFSEGEAHEDSQGMYIGGYGTYWKGVFYNLMLFDRTINMLSINMIKNLMNKDGIVDLSNPVFKNN